jgi:hypothetical protein
MQVFDERWTYPRYRFHPLPGRFHADLRFGLSVSKGVAHRLHINKFELLAYLKDGGQRNPRALWRKVFTTPPPLCHVAVLLSFMPTVTGVCSCETHPIEKHNDGGITLNEFFFQVAAVACMPARHPAKFRISYPANRCTFCRKTSGRS